MDRKDWTDALSEHVAGLRGERPVPALEDFGMFDYQKYRVQGSALVVWAEQDGPRMIQERHDYLRLKDEFEWRPAMLLRGALPFLAACRQVFGEHSLQGDARVTPLLDDEYAPFLERFPEPALYDYHLTHWSRFAAAGEDVRALAQARGLAPPKGESLHVHTYGTLWAPERGEQVEDLWSWDGERFQLIERAIRRQKYSPL